jgi:hypothetical protein
MAAMAANLDLVSVDYLTNACVNWSDFFCGFLGATASAGRFHLMMSAAARYTHHQSSPYSTSP